MMSVVCGSVSVGPAGGRTVTMISDFRFMIVDLKTDTIPV
jgi:hypothetical protein